MYLPYVLFLGWVSYMLICSVLLFTRGFLLNRQVLPIKAQCTHDKFTCPSHPADCLDLSHENFSLVEEQKCVDSNIKVILIIIDALRFDFLEHHENQTFEYQNQVQVVHKLLMSRPDSSRLYQFIADPPTTTLQRLKGLTTGSLPTFIDAGSNFASSEIDEDNIIDKLVEAKKRIIFLGDDTWTLAFPNRFTRQFPYPSFNVWDLDTVDNGINKHLVSEIKKEDWQLLVTHFLGVDHCGHRYGLYHPEMARKLKEMNKVIEDTISVMDNNTLLFVIGDHAMTATGDHGGDSEAEKKSAMFVYSPKLPLRKQKHYSTSVVKQTDLVPTLASIFGVAIPFSSLGSTIFEALPLFPNEDSSYAEIFINWNNIRQVTNYIKEYSKTNEFSDAKLSLVKDNFLMLKKNLERLKFSNPNEINDFIAESKKYLLQIRQMCQEIWVQFDAVSMSRGLVLTFLTLAFTFIILEGLTFDRFSVVFPTYFFISRLSIVFLSVVLIFLLKCSNLIDIPSVELTIYFFSTTASILFLAITIVQNWFHITQVWMKSKKAWFNIFYRVIFLISVITVFSNSYIVEETSVILFLVQSILLLTLWESRNKFNLFNDTNKKFKSFFSSAIFNSLLLVIILTIILRFSFNFQKCREEQTWCTHYGAHGSKDNLLFSESTHCILSVVSLASFIALVRNYLKMFGNLAGFSPTVFLSKYVPPIIIVCLSGYWLLDFTPAAKRRRLITSWQLLMLPRIVFSLIGIFLLVLFVFPTSLYYLRNRNNLSMNGAIPSLFQELKNLMKADRNKDDGNNPIVFGLATVYSSSFINFSCILCLLSAVLLGYNHGVTAVLMTVSLFIYTILCGVIRNSRKLINVQLFNIGWPYVIFWGLSSIFWFHVTGHQATFPTINWNAAFIGINSVEGFNLYLSALLVFGNTFISYIVHAALLPMLLIIPFTLHVTFPYILNSNENSNACDRKGDIVLYEQKNLLYHSIFNLSMKYLLFHGLRIFTSMFASVIHSRHLMVWKVFAPKFMFEAMSLILLTVPSLFIGFYLVIRVTNEIDRYLKKISLD